MIKVIFYQGQGFEVSGHAGFANSGKDIVCAAASILATTCVNALETVAKVVCQVDLSDGYLKAFLPQGLPPEKDHDAQVILQTFLQGIGDLVESYPQYITLKEKRSIT